MIPYLIESIYNEKKSNDYEKAKSFIFSNGFFEVEQSSKKFDIVNIINYLKTQKIHITLNDFFSIIKEINREIVEKEHENLINPISLHAHSIIITRDDLPF